MTADPETEALRDLASRIGGLRMRWLLPGIVLATLVGVQIGAAFLYGVWSFPGADPAVAGRRAAGAAVALAFVGPFLLVFLPSLVAYRLRVAREKRAWLDEVAGALDRETMEARARLFR